MSECLQWLGSPAVSSSQLYKQSLQQIINYNLSFSTLVLDPSDFYSSCVSLCLCIQSGDRSLPNLISLTDLRKTIFSLFSFLHTN